MPETTAVKPTAGPWKWEWSAANAIDIYADHGKRQNPHVANLCWEGPTGETARTADDFDAESLVMEADAALIAAAPDLLSALRFAVDDCCGDAKAPCEPCAAGRSAIALAEGR